MEMVGCYIMWVIEGPVILLDSSVVSINNGLEVLTTKDPDIVVILLVAVYVVAVGDVNYQHWEASSCC